MLERSDYAEPGGLMSYGANDAEQFRRAAYYIDKILKGTKPADLPVEQPMKFEFIINLKTAKQIGLTIPPNVLARADKVIQMKIVSRPWSGVSKNILCFVLCGMLVVLCDPTHAQQQAKIPKIGWLAVRPASAAFAIESFQREFSKLGYVDGKNIVFEYRYAEGKLDRLPALADELVRLKVDVIIAPNTPAAGSRQERYQDYPDRFYRRYGSYCGWAG